MGFLVGPFAIVVGVLMVVFRRPVGRWYSHNIRASLGSEDAAPSPSGAAILLIVVGVVSIAIGISMIVHAAAG